MKHVLIFQSGDTTCCASPATPSSMCRFVRTQRFGTKWVCDMFDVELFDGANDSWLQRDAKCMATFNGQKGLKMTCNEIIEIARAAGYPDWWLNPPEPERKGMTLPMLERFAKLIAERAITEVAQCKQ